ncbi:MAG: rubrerythrin family protein [Opitutales bacterium]|nr:rubrerythrin family protein [Opitutales bacterium]
MNIKGTKTEKNLMSAFAGESQARNRYTYFASVAKKEGYEQISAIFTETADNEKEHAKRFYKFLGETAVEITGTFCAHLGDTMSNLLAAAEGEYDEWHNLYCKFADEADEEGFAEIAIVFRKIAEVEAHHEARYRKLAQNIKEGKVFQKDSTIQWKCRNCGYIHTGTQAPEKCPACAHAKAHFEVLADNF